jgi:hypothetical protein
MRLVGAIGKCFQPAMSSSSRSVGASLSNARRLEGKAEWRYAQSRFQR